MKKGVWALNRLLSMQMFLSHFFLELRSHFENAGLSLVWNKNVSLVESSQKSLEQILASEVGKWKLFVFHNLSCFLRKNQFFIEVQLESTSSNMPDLLYMNSAWHIFKTHACDFESYLEFLGNLENKICTLVETRYFYYSNDFKNDKECWKSWHALLTSTKYCLSTKNEIHSMISRWLKTCQKFDLFWQKTLLLNVSVKKCDFEFFLLLLSHRIRIKL